MIDGPRACTPAELPEVIALVDGEMRRGSDQSMLTDYPLVYRPQNIENLRILKVNGELASVVPFIPRPVVVDDCAFTIGIISPTATAVTHRHRGYGVRCLQDCIARMQQVGCELSVLWTLPTTFPFYEKGDYQGVRSQGWVYTCTRADAVRFAGHGELIRRCDLAASRQLDALRAMRECQVCGVRRTDPESAILFGLPKLETLVAWRGDQPAAYLVVSRATNKPGLLEAGGDPPAVEALIHHALSALGKTESLPAYAHLTETVLGRLLEDKLPERRQPLTQGPMMVRVNDPAAFLRRIAPWLERRNAGADRAFCLSVAGETISLRFSRKRLELGAARLDPHLELSRRELAGVLFGAHPSRPVQVPAPLASLVPFYFPVWMLDHS